MCLLWSPSADQVDIIVYDKNNQDKVLAEHTLKQKALEAISSSKLTYLRLILALKTPTGYFYNTALNVEISQ